MKKIKLSFLMGFMILSYTEALSQVNDSIKNYSNDFIKCAPNDFLRHSSNDSIRSSPNDSSLSNLQRLFMVLFLPFSPLIVPDASPGFISVNRTFLNPTSRFLYEVGAFFWMYWFYTFFSSQFKTCPPQFLKIWNLR